MSLRGGALYGRARQPAPRRGSARRHTPRPRAALAAALIGLLLVGCADDDLRDADGTVVTAGSASVFELRAGDCLAPDPDVTGEVADLPLVPCADEHTQEVFGVVQHPDERYPGAEDVAAWADGACLTELEGALGLTLDDGVFVSYLLPTFDGWNTDGDREVICVLVFPGQEAVTGSYVAGTALIEPTPPAPPQDPADSTDA